MAQATAKDLPLSVFLNDFPPKWDGFIQLRMYFGTDGQAPLENQYPALNLYISGDTWTAVGGGQVNCNAGSAESLETAVLSPSAATAGSKGHGGSSAKGGDGNGGSGGSQSANSTGGHGSPTSGGTVSATATKTPLFLTFLIVVLILLAVAALFVGRRIVLRRRQLATASQPPNRKGPTS
jgi:hypothetical protein